MAKGRKRHPARYKRRGVTESRQREPRNPPGPDDQVNVIIGPADAGTPPEGAGEHLGYLRQAMDMGDGTVMPAGSSVWQDLALDPANRSARAIVESAELAAILRGEAEATTGMRAPIFRRADPGRPAIYLKDQPALPGSEQGSWKLRPRQGGLDSDQLYARLDAISPGLARRLGEGLSQAEVNELAPGIAQAMREAGAGPGTYSFTTGDPDYGSKVIVGEHAGMTGEAPVPAAFRKPAGTRWQREGEIPPPGAIPAAGILGGRRSDGGEGLPYGIRPGDIIAAEQPLGYEDTGIVLPEGSGHPAGSKVWRPAAGAPVPETLEELSGQVRAMLDSGMLSEDVAAELEARMRERRAGSFQATMAAVLNQPGSPAVSPARTGWQAEDVLNRHARLAKRYSGLDRATVSYLVHVLNSCWEDSPEHAAVNHWPVDTQGRRGPAEGRQMARIVGRGLREALTYQVTAPMVAQMAESENMMPGVLKLSEGDLPAIAGFAWLDYPWAIPVGGRPLPVRAVSWEKMILPASDGSIDAVRLVFWVHVPDTIAFGHFAGDDERIAILTADLGDLIPHHITILPLSARIALRESHADESMSMIALIHSLWVFLGMELSASRTVRPSSRAHSRKVLASIRHDRVHVITLRRVNYIYPGNGANGHRVVNRTCKWWVPDFYRHIDPYRDEDADGRARRHEAEPANRNGAVPDDDHDVCGVCLARGQTVRIALVHGHRRGPAYLPWKTAAKDRTVRRLSR